MVYYFTSSTRGKINWIKDGDHKLDRGSNRVGNLFKIWDHLRNKVKRVHANDIKWVTIEEGDIPEVTEKESPIWQVTLSGQSSDLEEDGSEMEIELVSWGSKQKAAFHKEHERWRIRQIGWRWNFPQIWKVVWRQNLISSRKNYHWKGVPQGNRKVIGVQKNLQRRWKFKKLFHV